MLGALPMLLALTTTVRSRNLVVKTLSFESFSLLCDVGKLTAAQFSYPVLLIRSTATDSQHVKFNEYDPKKFVLFQYLHLLAHKIVLT
jgi:hypothetical protein